MVVGELVRAELRRVDWASLKCGCGDSAEHVPLLFEAIITAETPRDMIGYTLDDHVEGDTVIFECTPPAVGVIMAAPGGRGAQLGLARFRLAEEEGVAVGEPAQDAGEEVGSKEGVKSEGGAGVSAGDSRALADKSRPPRQTPDRPPRLHLRPQEAKRTHRHLARHTGQLCQDQRARLW
ncbi:hypothetical protein ACFYP6_32495 [Streptomyces goshikiensis]|uniref:hypothetical protein n=1 Tax=Streptomyces goshikiensis TaxID=1942 RepID=UPI0036A306A1